MQVFQCGWIHKRDRRTYRRKRTDRNNHSGQVACEGQNFLFPFLNIGNLSRDESWSCTPAGFRWTRGLWDLSPAPERHLWPLGHGIPGLLPEGKPRSSVSGLARQIPPCFGAALRSLSGGLWFHQRPDSIQFNSVQSLSHPPIHYPIKSNSIQKPA